MSIDLARIIVTEANKDLRGLKAGVEQNDFSMIGTAVASLLTLRNIADAAGNAGVANALRRKLRTFENGGIPARIRPGRDFAQ